MTASNIGNGPEKNFNAKEERKVCDDFVLFMQLCQNMYSFVHGGYQ